MGFIKKVVTAFFADDAMTHAAALAYYGALSLAPLVLILLWIASLIGPQAQQKVVDEAVTAMGERAGGVLSTIIDNAQEQPSLADVSGIVGLVVLLFSAASVFVQLQHALNRIWDVEARSDAGVWNIVRKRLLSFGIVLLLGVLLLASLVLGSALSIGFGVFGGAAALFGALNEAVIFAVLVAFLGLIFKYLPDVKVSWRDVWLGAVVTAVLLTIGKFLISLYLGRSSVASGYGAAGSLVLLLVWAYYSGIILLFGAEFTQAWARRSGRRIVPDEHAQPAPQPPPSQPPPGTEPPRPPAQPDPGGQPAYAVQVSSGQPCERHAGESWRQGGERAEWTIGALLRSAVRLLPLLVGALLLGSGGGRPGRAGR